MKKGISERFLNQRFLEKSEILLNHILSLCHSYEWSSNKMTNAYIGIDLTGDSLHIGHLFCLLWADSYRLVTQSQLYVVLGDYTTILGADPTSRIEERKPIDIRHIYKNGLSLLRQIRVFLPHAKIVWNSQWLASLNIKDVFDISKHHSVSEFISWETFSMRLKNGLKISEMMYPLLQGYDFQYLYSNKQVGMQISGSDQINNIKVGRRMINRDDITGYILLPLIENKDGKKIGKSVNLDGIIPWLSKNKINDFDLIFWCLYIGSDVILQLSKWCDVKVKNILISLLELRDRSTIEAIFIIKMIDGNYNGYINMPFIGKIKDLLVKYCGLKNLSAANNEILNGNVSINEIVVRNNCDLKDSDRIIYSSWKIMIWNK